MEEQVSIHEQIRKSQHNHRKYIANIMEALVIMIVLSTAGLIGLIMLVISVVVA